MIFSKSFGYSVRGLLYIALMKDEKRNVQVEEIAAQLSVPKYFLQKILMNLVKNNILGSIKGPNGGFFINYRTLSTSLLTIMDVTDGLADFKECVLRLHECNGSNPCPLHCQMDEVKRNIKNILIHTTVNDLLQKDKPAFINSITTIKDFNVIINTQ